MSDFPTHRHWGLLSLVFVVTPMPLKLFLIVFTFIFLVDREKMCGKFSRERNVSWKARFIVSNSHRACSNISPQMIFIDHMSFETQQGLVRYKLFQLVHSTLLRIWRRNAKELWKDRDFQGQLVSQRVSEKLVRFASELELSIAYRSTRKHRRRKVLKLCSTSTKGIRSLTLTMRSDVLVRVCTRSAQDAFRFAPLILRAKEKLCRKVFLLIFIGKFTRICWSFKWKSTTSNG